MATRAPTGVLLGQTTGGGRDLTVVASVCLGRTTQARQILAGACGAHNVLGRPLGSCRGIPPRGGNIIGLSHSIPQTSIWLVSSPAGLVYKFCIQDRPPVDKDGPWRWVHSTGGLVLDFGVRRPSRGAGRGGPLRGPAEQSAPAGSRGGPSNPVSRASDGPSGLKITGVIG